MNPPIELRPITQADLSAVLEVYRECEDFLALGPEPTASMQRVLKDLGTSQREGGVFCGIYSTAGKMIGVVEYVPHSFRGEASIAFLSLLMIAKPHRNRGIGKRVLERIEGEIVKDPQVTAILTAVQVNNPRALHFWQKHGYRTISGPVLQPDQTTTCYLQKENLL